MDVFKIETGRSVIHTHCTGPRQCAVNSAAVADEKKIIAGLRTYHFHIFDDHAALFRAAQGGHVLISPVQGGMLRRWGAAFWDAEPYEGRVGDVPGGWVYRHAAIWPLRPSR